MTVVMVWLGVAVGIAVCLGAGISVILYTRRQTPSWRVTQANRVQREARERVDAVLSGAKIMMEQIAGHRRPGERRITDGLGSWRDWH